MKRFFYLVTAILLLIQVTSAQSQIDSLVCDKPYLGRIATIGDSKLISFRVSENEIFSITIVKSSPAGTNFNPYWRILDRSGVPASSCGSQTINSSEDCDSLSPTGNPYRIEVTDFFNDDTGNFRILLQRLTSNVACDDVLLTCNTPFTTTIDDAVDSDLFSFCAPDNERVSISVTLTSGTNFNPYWRLLDGTGRPAVTCGSFTISSPVDCGPLPASGNPYRIHVTDFFNDGTGTYVVRVNFLTSGCSPMPPPPPILALPSNGSTGISINPTLSWNASCGATSYQLQVSTTSTFSTTVFDQSGITATTFPISGLSYDTNYFWRVRAFNQVGPSAWSTVWSFRTIVEAPPPPLLASPPDGSLGISINSTMSWNASARATSYRLQISTTVSFSTIVFDQSGITGTSVTVSGLSNNTLYYWRVYASNAGGTSGESVIWRFTTILAAPLLASPPDGANCLSTNPTLIWNASSGATSYQLQVSTNSSFSTTVVNQSGITNLTFTVSGLSFNTAYFWRVRASNASGTSDWSSVRRFMTTLAAPLLASPADGSTGVPINPTLTWNASGGATSYRLQVSITVSFSNIVFDRSGITGTAAVVSGLSNKTLYYWRVYASNASCLSIESSPWRFTTIEAAPAAPLLASPPDGAIEVLTNPTLKWNVSSGATSYRVQVSTAPSFSTTVRDTSGITADSLRLRILLINTIYYWRVYASNAGGTSPPSTPWSFTTRTTAVSDRGKGTPSKFSLSQNYPNPFNPSTTFQYSLPKAVYVKLTIFNPLGNEIETLVSQTQAAGEYEIHWNPSNLTSGIYLYRLEAGKFVATRKMILMR